MLCSAATVLAEGDRQHSCSPRGSSDLTFHKHDTECEASDPELESDVTVWLEVSKLTGYTAWTRGVVSFITQQCECQAGVFICVFDCLNVWFCFSAFPPPPPFLEDYDESPTDGQQEHFSDPAVDEVLEIPWLELLHVWVHDMASKEERLRK